MHFRSSMSAALRAATTFPLVCHLPLIGQLVRRDVLGRYKGSVLGVAWSLLIPLMMLAIFTFVFGSIFQAKWTAPASTPFSVASPTGTPEFALILFIGLIVFTIFSEVISRAPNLVLENTSYVKQIVFPLEILVPVAIGSAAVHAVISFAVLASFMLLFTGTIPVTVLWLPVVVGPLLVLTLGLGWFLTSVGVYLRDLGQLTGPLMSGLMFLSPIFYPSSAQPEWLRAWLRLNPLTLPIEQARNAVIWGVTPDLIGLVVYTMIALGVAVLGYLWFQKTRKGFADVI